MATIKDIARKAGVSMMTVSRAFNKPDLVKEELRIRILETAADLGYVPNQAAKSLASQRSGVIQMITNMDQEDPYFAVLLLGAANYLSEKGYSVMVSRSQTLAYEYDGAIAMGLAPGDAERLMELIGKPLVIYGKTELSLDWVDIDNESGTYQATEALIEAGHRKIGYLGFDGTFHYVKERHAGFRAAMKAHGLEGGSGERELFSACHDDIESVLDRVLAMDVTAFVCETDLLAYLMIGALNAAGLSVPEDVSVTGFDGFLYHQIAKPAIATVRQPVYRIGRELAKAIVWRLDHPEGDLIRNLIPLSFLEGGSVQGIG